MRRIQIVILGILLAAQVGSVRSAGASSQAPLVRAAVAAPTQTPSPTVGTVPVKSMTDLPQLLAYAWQGYKTGFISYDGRVIDPAREAVTTSEGQSYALLRAVWMNDRQEFDLVWQWTRNNLQVRKDKLFGYLWGHKGTKWSIIDKASATDADEDIALALVFASHQWHDPTYLAAGREVIRDIWRIEVAHVRDQPYLTAGSWAVSGNPRGPVVDPSYFAPYAYRIFAGVDHADKWQQLVKTSYQVLTECSRSPLNSKKSAGLPPNWCMILRASGKVAQPAGFKRASTYGYDAFRVMWRVALDYMWFKASAAKSYLQKTSFLRQQWQHKGRLYAEYTHNGRVKTAWEDPTIYGGDLGNFAVTNRHAALTIARMKLLPTFTLQGSGAYWGDIHNYYEQNWVWFGLALLGGQLPNLAR